MNFRIVWTLLLALVISGCNIFGGPKGNNIKQSIIDRKPAVGLKQIKLDDYGDGDAVLYYLEKGSLHKMAGQFDESNAAFEAAKDKMEELYTTSISKGIGSILLNDNATDYDGEHFENIMAHVQMALNYLEMGNIENAAVIARQLDSKLSKLAHEKADESGNVYKCDPFANYLSGLIFEGMNNWGSARVTYERAYKCYLGSIYKIGVPLQLKQALLKAAKLSGAGSIYRRYKKEFGLNYKLNINKSKGELVFVLDEGFVISKRESSLSISAATPNGLRQVKIAMPGMPDYNSHLVSKIRVKINNQIHMAERVHDLDSAARAALDERLPAIRARAVARAIKNQAVQNEAGEQGGFFGQLLAVIATNAVEKADVRGWRSLPHTVWMSRKELPAGTYNIEVELIGRKGHVMNIKQYKNIKIKGGAKKNLYLRWAATPAYNWDRKNRANIIIF